MKNLKKFGIFFYPLFFSTSVTSNRTFNAGLGAARALATAPASAPVFVKDSSPVSTLAPTSVPVPATIVSRVSRVENNLLC